MAALVRAHDWSKSRLGPVERWSPSLRLVVDIVLASSFPMAVRWGPDFVLIYNDGYRPILGDKHPGALGLPFREAWPEVQSRLGPLHEDILAGKSSGLFSEDLPLTIRRRGGQWEEARFTVSYSSIPDSTSNSGVGGVLVTAVETTERVHIEQALRAAESALRRSNLELQESEERFRLVAENAPVMLWMGDVNGKCLYLNAAQREFWGVSPADVPRFDWNTTLLPDDREKLFEPFGRAMQAHTAFTVEARYRRSDGEVRLLQTDGRPRFGPGGEFVGMIGVNVDVTERRRAEQKLRESEMRYRSALTVGGMGNWETDFVSGTRIWSEEGMALFGLALEEGRGQVGGEADEFKQALHPDDRHLVEGFHRQARQHDSFPAEYRIVRPDGTIRWLSGRGQVVARGADGKPERLVNVVTDITDRKVAEHHIQMLMREISHRSKNLLAVVQAIAAQTVRTAGTMKEFQKRFTQRLQGLAASHDLLVHKNWQGASLADLVRDQLAPFAEVGTPRLTVEGPDVVVSPEAAEAVGLALHELATNAVKYGALSEQTGHVSISWGFESLSRASSQLRLRWAEQGGPLVLPPSHKGFGHVVFERIVAKSLDGKVLMNFLPEGLIWELLIPAANLVSGRPAVDQPAVD